MALNLVGTWHALYYSFCFYMFEIFYNKKLKISEILELLRVMWGQEMRDRKKKERKKDTKIER